MDSPSIIIVEDDQPFRETLCLEFTDRGYFTASFSSLTDLKEGLKKSTITFRFAIVDLRIKTDEGLDALPLILNHNPSCRIVMLTGYSSIATAVEAVKRGAINYLTKPVNMTCLEHALWTDQPEPLSEEKERPFETLAKHEREYIEYVLKQCDGNITQAARQLGLHRQSLQRKLRKFSPK